VSHGMAAQPPPTLITTLALPRSVWLQKDDGSRMQAKVLGAMPGGLLYNVMAGGMVQKVGAAALAPMVPGEQEHSCLADMLCWCPVCVCIASPAAAAAAAGCAAALAIGTAARHVPADPGHLSSS
jgi:hypothetical protein